MTKEIRKEQLKEIIILLLDINPLFRNKHFKKVIEEDPKVFYKTQWKEATHEQKAAFVEDTVIFDDVKGTLSDILLIYNTYMATGNRKDAIKLLKSYKENDKN